MKQETEQNNLDLNSIYAQYPVLFACSTHSASLQGQTSCQQNQKSDEEKNILRRLWMRSDNSRTVRDNLSIVSILLLIYVCLLAI